MEALKTIVSEEVAKYAGLRGFGANIYLFKVLDDERCTYAVISVDFQPRKDDAGIVIFARVVEDTIIVEHDATDRPLLDALIQRGVPRSQIVLAYRNEPTPATAYPAVPWLQI